MDALIADISVAFGFVLMIVLAAVVAVCGTIGLVLSLVAKLFRGICRATFGGMRCMLSDGEDEERGESRAFEPTPRPQAGSRRDQPGRTCSRPGCGHVNPSVAVYCGQCGQPL